MKPGHSQANFGETSINDYGMPINEVDHQYIMHSVTPENFLNEQEVIKESIPYLVSKEGPNAH